MYKVEIVSGNPNKKVGTFTVKRGPNDPDIMGPFQKIVHGADSALRPYSVLAHNIFNFHVTNGKPVYNSISYARNGDTTVIGVGHVLGWTLATRANIGGLIQTFMNSGNPALRLDRAEDIMRKFETRKVFESKDPVTGTLMKAFEKEVNPILQRDGGSMEVLGISYENAKVVTELMLMGSCRGCSDSELKTLAGAHGRMREALEVIKEQSPKTSDVQKLSIAPFKIAQLPELILSR